MRQNESTRRSVLTRGDLLRVFIVAACLVYLIERWVYIPWPLWPFLAAFCVFLSFVIMGIANGFDESRSKR